MKIVAYDFGGSTNREVDIVKDGAMRKTSSKFKRLDPISETNPARMDIEVPTDDFVIEKTPWERIQGQRFAKTGAFGMYKEAIEGTDNQENKSKQDGTYINACYMIATAILNGASYTSIEEIGDGKHIKIYEEGEVRAGVCIPAGEFYAPNGFEHIKAGLAGDYSVFFPALGKRVNWTIEKAHVTVTPEGVVALYVLFGTEYEKLIRTSTVLIFDGGYRSLDVTAVENFSPQGGSSRSFPIGGITLEALVANEMERAGLFISNQDVVQAIETGFIINKGKDMPVGKYVQAAKKVLARRFYTSGLEVLNATGKFKRNVQYLVPVGRCFEVVGKEGEENYTGSLINDIAEIWGDDIQTITVPNLEEANVRGVAQGMKKKYAGALQAAAAEERTITGSGKYGV